MARRKGRSLTRKDVVQAAITCLQEAGEEGLGVKHVAQQLGIKPPSLYNHVEGHQDIRRLVAIEGWRSFFSHLSQHEHNPSHIHLAQQMKSFATQHSPLYAVMGTTQLSPQDPDYEPVHQAHNHFFSRWFQQHHGHVVEDCERAATTLRSFVHGYCLMHLFGHHSQQDTTFEQAVDKLFPSLPPPKVQRHRSIKSVYPPQIQAHHVEDPSDPPT